MHPSSSGTRRATPVALLLLLMVAGCGKAQYPVRGKVTFEDGTPVTKGMVVFESMEGEKMSARGEVQTDGSYQLSTHKPGDGVPAGKYRVLVAPKLNIDSPQPERDRLFDPRYEKFESSGLEFEVKSGSNEFAIQVTRPGKSRR
jgi:hypothetical protein